MAYPSLLYPLPSLQLISLKSLFGLIVNESSCQLKVPQIASEEHLVHAVAGAVTVQYMVLLFWCLRLSGMSEGSYTLINRI